MFIIVRSLILLKRKTYLLFCLCLNTSVFAQTQPYMIGTGIYDITGPAAEVNMMGYAQLTQLDAGIQTRLWSRAFVIEDVKKNTRVVFISADLGMVFNSVTQGVLKQLKQKYANLYTKENVMLSATHTHSGPAGYSFRTLFNITSRGFDKDNYDAIVNGIVHSIERAHNNLEPGNILINSGELTNTSTNRSLSAYLKNPSDERSQYEHTTDKSVTQLTFMNAHNENIGLINWHAVHGVSMSKHNKLISGDNKGHASYLFEQSMHANYQDDKTFVAAFAQANEGDASPNIFTEINTGKCEQLSCPDLVHSELIGQRQFDKALELYKQAQTFIGDGVDFRHQTINMENQTLDEHFSHTQSAQTDSAALGYAFGAGTSDGHGLDKFFSQGQLQSNPLVSLLRNIIAMPSKHLQQAQYPKPILLAVGLNKPAWVSHNLPIQLFKIGKLVIAGVPGEFTTMAGRRLKKQLKTTFGSEAEHIVIAGLANDYAGYVTTYEEYQKQNYEAGFTLFGPWTLAAYQQNFANLARDMLNGTPTPHGPSPEDLHTNTGSLIPPVIFDDTPPATSFGDVHAQPNANYHKGELAHSVFWAGHPRNDFETMTGFFEIQRLINNQWQTIAHDWDANTSYYWQRIAFSYSFGHVYWKIPLDTTSGTYRIKHHGHYKYGWDRKIYPYTGTTHTFKVS
mgnify:CR=1 FL=1